MADSRELFVNPNEIRNCSNQINSIADQMKDTLDNLVIKMESTEATYQAQSATDMRDKFNELKPELEKFTAYLRKVSAYLIQNVAEPAEVVDQVASQNVASIAAVRSITAIVLLRFSALCWGKESAMYISSSDRLRI